MRYLSPAVHIVNVSPNHHILVTTSNSWEESLESTGSKWGGEDKDDSDYGL